MGASINDYSDIQEGMRFLTPENELPIGSVGKGVLGARGGLLVLHLKGTSYERGFQHGSLLADQIFASFSKEMTKYSLLYGQGNVEAGMKLLRDSTQLMKPYVTPALRKEIQGIADGAASKDKDITFDDILLMNCVSNVLLFPHGLADPAAATMHEPFSDNCSAFAAWGNATADGKLIYGKNTDLGVMTMPDFPVVIINEPQTGYASICPSFPGVVTVASGMNEAGLAVGSNFSGSKNATMRGTPAFFLVRVILDNAASIDDAITILSTFPRQRGMNFIVADGKAKDAVVVEVSGTELAVRHGQEDTICATNHFNCYPGWQGYSGHNMVPGQAAAYKLNDISTIEKWQESVKQADPSSFARYQRLKDLLEGNYGEIDAAKATSIMSDRFDLLAGRILGWDEYGYAVCALGHQETIARRVKYYRSGQVGPITDQHITWSSEVGDPEDLLVWIAIGNRPAQRGKYILFDLKKEIPSVKYQLEKYYQRSTTQAR